MGPKFEFEPQHCLLKRVACDAHHGVLQTPSSPHRAVISCWSRTFGQGRSGGGDMGRNPARRTSLINATLCIRPRTKQTTEHRQAHGWNGSVSHTSDVEQSWDELMPLIIDLYAHMKLETVRQLLAEKHNFVESKQAYKRRLAACGIRKNITIEEKELMLNGSSQTTIDPRRLRRTDLSSFRRVRAGCGVLSGCYCIVAGARDMACCG